MAERCSWLFDVPSCRDKYIALISSSLCYGLIFRTSWELDSGSTAAVRLDVSSESTRAVFTLLTGDAWA